ncbi:scopoletin glucosyltransferase [Elaeis guineensis]|uniref:Glycosyltransferase n=1 Tax=Elaeis guineensis var. tenera TaxID=51953 RepID=A0A6I9SBK5_ELAGV|nr:scopoletin glucosyltransferase [Elaeis guineensis]
MDSEAHTLHLLFFPVMAQGHVLPMVDMAKLFAARGVKATFVTTAANAAAVEAAIGRANRSYLHPIHLLLLPFPATAVGLPEGTENLSLVTDDAPSQEKFLAGVTMLQGPFRHAVADLHPDAILTDWFLPWTVDVAEEFNIPRLVFHGTSFFSRCVAEALGYNPQPAVADSIVIPGFPHRIQLLKSQLPAVTQFIPAFANLLDQIAKKEWRSYGVVVNSFYELEPDYAELFRKGYGKKAWHVGPVSLCNKELEDKSLRGNRGAVDHDECLKWLDKKEPGSVVYVCFGSQCLFSRAELRELALGFENCGHPFLWVVRSGVDGWMPDGYEERIGGRGLIVTGWAPQILILNHEAVGCFMTHCGWNSTLEGVTAGVPMITRPLFAEQFYNEKLIVEVLRIGVGVGAKNHGERPDDRELVGAPQIERALRRLMDGGEEAEGMKRHAKELGEMAKKAMEEGGSSYVDMGNLIQELMDRRSTIST